MCILCNEIDSLFLFKMRAAVVPLRFTVQAVAEPRPEDLQLITHSFPLVNMDVG